MSSTRILILPSEHNRRAVHIPADFWRWSGSIGNSVLVSSALLLYEHILPQDVPRPTRTSELDLALSFLIWRLFRVFQIQPSCLGLFNKTDLRLLYLTKNYLFIFIQQHGHKVKADGACFRHVQYPDLAFNCQSEFYKSTERLWTIMKGCLG